MLSDIRTLIIDKTGTLTNGRTLVRGVECQPGFDAADVLRLAASLDQASTHVLAAALAEAALARGLHLSFPSGTKEEPGAGTVGEVDGHVVAIGGGRFVAAQLGQPPEFGQVSHGKDVITVAVAIDGAYAGEIVMEDTLRKDAHDTVAELRRLGIDRIILASGDREEIAKRVTSPLGLDEIYGELDPAAKAQLAEQRRSAGPLMMVGDGVNDAPGLAVADVGVAMGARGTAASTEAAGAVILVDDLRPLAHGIAIAQRTRRIALQSVWAGLGLSFAAMIVAALGYLPPVQGALLQEAIDIAVIFNALRALR